MRRVFGSMNMIVFYESTEHPTIHIVGVKNVPDPNAVNAGRAMNEIS